MPRDPFTGAPITGGGDRDVLTGQLVTPLSQQTGDLRYRQTALAKEVADKGAPVQEALRDNFGGTGPLSSRQADLGGGYAVTSGTPTLSGSGRLASGSYRFRTNDVPLKPDQDYCAKLDVQSGFGLVWLRASGGNTGYFVGSNSGTPVVIAIARDGTDRGVIVQGGANAISYGEHTMLATVRNTTGGVVFGLYVDGVNVLPSTPDAAASRMMDAGTGVGLWFANLAGNGVDLMYAKTYPFKNDVIGGIGNSIMQGTGTTGGNDPLSAMAAHVGYLTGNTPGTANLGATGTTVETWAPGGAQLTNAKAVMAGVGVRDVMMLFGANEAKTADTFSLARYLAGYRAIVDDMVASGFRMWLWDPSNIAPGAYGQWGDDPGPLLASFGLQEMSLINGTTVMAGDRNSFVRTSFNPSRLPDGVHDGNAEAVQRGRDAAVAYLLGNP